MASRIGLGRIIAWGKEADMEELHYALHRLGNIAQVRAARVEGADALGKVKRGRKAKNQLDNVARAAGLPSAADLDVVVKEREASA